MNMGKLLPILDHTDQVLKCSSVEAVWALHIEMMSKYGFDRLLYISTNLRTHGVWGDISDALILTNYEKEFLDVYIGQGLHKQATVARTEGYKPGAYSWQHSLERPDTRELTKAEMSLAELRAKWEIKAGYTIWFGEISERDRAFIGLCARRELAQDDVNSLWVERGNEICMLNNLVHLKLSQLPHMGSWNPLTARQREVLQWVADGKTTKDIAQIMRLSEGTVAKHLQLARKAFGVETTGQAIRKASIWKQFFVSQDD